FFKNKKDAVATNQAKEVLDGRTIFRLMRHFPVGAKLQYYPEYQKNIVLDSVVIAYAINGIFVYSTAGLSCDESSGVLQFSDQDQKWVFKKITSFRIILPVFSHSETKLDYIRREELLKVGGLVKGNVITLMAEQSDGQVPVLETIVERRTMLKEGFYANQTVALLEVDAATLMLSDQRAHLRLKTNISATIQVRKRGENTLLNCTMIDFSDRSLRLQMAADTAAEAMPQEGGKLLVSFNLPGQSEYISLMGEVFRIEGDAIVVMLTGLVRAGQSVELGQIEMLKIKANLLQHAGANLAK
ncbi:MAG TPA: PilZ domain-containing protein, partial [Candidatus Tenderia electrophaga]|nr:PilZ domain-containing protein [Candidatus Tenderia electrophaga]